MPKGSIEGTVVAVVGRDFKPFTNSQGETVSGGTTFRAWVVKSFEEAPEAVKVKATVAEQLLAAGPGAFVKSETWLRARGDRIEQEVDAESFVIFPAGSSPDDDEPF